MRADFAGPTCARLLQLAVHHPAEVAAELGVRDPDVVFLDGATVRAFVRMLTVLDAAPLPAALAAIGGGDLAARVAWIRLLPCTPPTEGEICTLIDAMETWRTRVTEEADVLASVLEAR